jgi:hypothetical protein
MDFSAETIVLATTFLLIGLTLGVLVCSIKTEKRISVIRQSALHELAQEKARITADLDEQFHLIKDGMAQISSAYEKATQIIECNRVVSAGRKPELEAPVRLAIGSTNQESAENNAFTEGPAPINAPT